SGHASPGYLGRSCKSKGPRRSGVPGGACSAAVAVRVAGQRTLDAMPGGAGRLAGVLPLQPRITAVARLVVAAQLRLDLVEVAPLVPRPRLVAGTVGRPVVLVGVVRLDVGLVAVVLLPVLVLRGRVHAFGHALAGEAAGDGAHGRSHGGTDRAGRRADRRAGDASARGAHAGTNRVCARGAGDRVAVLVTVLRVAMFVCHVVCSWFL